MKKMGSRQKLPIALKFLSVSSDYFLEVNPFGQYGFVSLAGNFHIEKLIAKML